MTPPADRGTSIPSWLRSLDARILAFTRRWSRLALRASLGIVFVWFGALKLAGVSPVASLVADTLFWLPRGTALPALGAFEVIVGVLLLTGYAIRLTLLLFALQMLGTFLVFVVLPERAFARGNPLLLTVEGEFVIKNLVLLCAALVIASGVPAAHPEKPLGRMLTEKPAEPPPASRARA